MKHPHSDTSPPQSPAPTEAELACWEKWAEFCLTPNLPAPIPPECEAEEAVLRLIDSYRYIRFQLARKIVAALPMGAVEVTRLIDKLEAENKALREALDKVYRRALHRVLKNAREADEHDEGVRDVYTHLALSDVVSIAAPILGRIELEAPAS